jgi:hypothetical protein
MSRAWKVADLLAAGAFILCAGVQINDPDPVLWVGIYGLAAAHCLVSIRRPVPWGLSVFMAVLCGVGVVWVWRSGLGEPHLMPGFPSTGLLREERVREALGLGLVGGWMTLSAWRAAGTVSPGPD